MNMNLKLTAQNLSYKIFKFGKSVWKKKKVWELRRGCLHWVRETLEIEEEGDIYRSFLVFCRI